jgi:hypothetical protein
MGQVRLIATEFTAETMQPRVDAEILPPAVVEEEVEAAIDEIKWIARMTSAFNRFMPYLTS